MADISAQPPLDRSHIAPVRSRDELIYLLARACELEHSVACVYLFAAHSLKSDASEGGMTEAQAAMVRGWKRRLVAVGVEEMLHLAQLTNVMTAIGGAPHFQRPNFPLRHSGSPINDLVSLEPFSRATLERFMCIEMPEPGILSPQEQAEADAVRLRVLEGESAITPPGAPAGGSASVGGGPFDIDFATQGEFYHKIITGFDHIPERELFIGPPETQAKSRFVDFGDELRAVADRRSARAAIEMVIEQGEAPTAAHPDAHFWVFRKIHAEYMEALRQAEAGGVAFDPVRPVVSNPLTRFYEDVSAGTLIADPLTHQLADIFNIAYDTMLMMLLRFFAHTEETDGELERLARAAMRLMANVLAPLGEALAKMPAGHGGPLAGRTAGPGFGYNRDIELLPHKRSAWVFFGERLRHLAAALTRLWATQAARLPAEVEAAVAGLQGVSLQFAPADPTFGAATQLAALREIEASVEAGIKPLLNGPLLVANVDRLTDSGGQPLPASPETALCRCGASRNKPFCDGAHSRVGFLSARSAERTPDRVENYRGAEIIVHFNRLQCSAAEECARGLPGVFREGERPWIQPDNARAEEIVEAVRRCPSGALRYTFRGETGPRRADAPGIRIRRNGPYEVTGSIPLRTSFWCEGATRDRYALCRCGQSTNKPFCDGSHWKVGFKDDNN